MTSTLNPQKNSRFSISKNIVYRQHDDGNYILIEIEGDNVYELDDVSSFVFSQIIENFTYEEIITTLNQEYEDIFEKEIEEVNQFIKDLLEQNIVSLKE